MWYVYILRCRDGSLYTGISTDVDKRILRHNQGKGSQYTRSRRPVTLLYTEPYVLKSDALKREVQIKRLSVKNKKRVIMSESSQRFPSA
ncbi:MAG: GIY-YIG nuclease family protein [Candidatus Omnitrophica bacterium]|nr:GIY-YIG nuclease family protein [Candidatus Omnitrophota bacterium]